MNKAFFTAIQTLATLAITASVIAIQAGDYLVAGVTGFLGVVCYLAYELVPEKPTDV